jgi:hypothetical protein
MNLALAAALAIAGLLAAPAPAKAQCPGGNCGAMSYGFTRPVPAMYAAPRYYQPAPRYFQPVRYAAPAYRYHHQPAFQPRYQVHAAPAFGGFGGGCATCGR